MVEFIKSVTVIFCGLTYWLGGQEVPWTQRGYKWFRRYVMPLGLFFAVMVLGAKWLDALVACAFLSGITHIGYQDKLWKYALTGLGMGLGATLLGAGPWMLLPMAFHTLFGYLSLRFNKFLWSYVAILTGISIGIAYTIGL